MKAIRTMLAGLVILFAFNAAVIAQEKTKAASESKPSVPVKILVVFTEYDGEKKISSMPYNLSALATEDRTRNNASLRMGLKVPITVAQNQIQYQDVGTDIDARVEPQPDGRFYLWMQVRRSTVQNLEGSLATNNETSGRPVMRAFSSGFEGFIVRDGQPTQTTSATDPISGRVLKVEVTITAVK